MKSKSIQKNKKKLSVILNNKFINYYLLEFILKKV